MTPGARRAFTLIEIAVTLAVIGVLAAAGIVGWQHFKTSAQTDRSSVLVSEIMADEQAWHLAHGGYVAVPATGPQVAPARAMLARITPGLEGLSPTFLPDGTEAKKAGDVSLAVSMDGKALAVATVTETGQCVDGVTSTAGAPGSEPVKARDLAPGDTCTAQETLSRTGH